MLPRNCLLWIQSLLITSSLSVSHVSSTRDLVPLSNVSTIVECPTWYRLSESDPDKCVCGDTLDGKVRCLQDEQVGMVVGNCMTYTNDETLIGLCPYAPSKASFLDDIYTTLPSNVSDLDSFMCGGINRTGLLCSECMEGQSLAVMSYERRCVECISMSRGIVSFIALALIPTTLFFLLVMVCTIDISSGPMNAALTILQVNLAQVNQNPADYVFKSSNPLSYNFVIFLLTFYGIWNLDFLRYIIPPFCISSSLTSLQAQALEYVVAVYPLFLIIVTYVGVELYDSEYRLVMSLWQPFKKLFSFKCLKNLNVKYSLITTFATFFQLVYARLFFISKEILNYSELKNSTGDTIDTVLAMDASIPYGSSQHIPYIVMATIMLFIFNMTPLFLLLFYPTKCFQLLLGCFPGVNWHPLHAFMDIFQGCYKNGTNGTKDCRCFTAFNLLIRIFMLAPIDSHSISSLKLVLVPLIFSILLAILRPYQRNILNLWGIFCYFMCTLNQLWVMCSTYDAHLSFELVYLSHLILFSYFCLLIVGKTVKTVSPRCYSACMERFRRCVGKISSCSCMKTKVVDLERGDVVRMHASCEGGEEFPDRVNNPQDYQPLLAQSRSSSEAGIKHMVIASYGVN